MSRFIRSTNEFGGFAHAGPIDLPFQFLLVDASGGK